MLLSRSLSGLMLLSRSLNGLMLLSRSLNGLMLLSRSLNGLMLPSHCQDAYSSFITVKFQKLRETETKGSGEGTTICKSAVNLVGPNTLR